MSLALRLDARREFWTAIAVPPDGGRHWRADEIVAGAGRPERADSLLKLAGSREEVFERLRRRERSDPDFRKTFAGTIFFPVRIDEGYRVP